MIEFVELADAVPSDLPDLVASDLRRLSALREPGSPDWAARAEKFREQSVRELQNAVRRFQGTALESWFRPEAWNPEAYEFCRFVKTALERIAQMDACAPIAPEPIELPVPLFQQEEAWADAKGILHIQPKWPSLAEQYGRFRAALDGLDTTSVRQCPACSKLFWKRRSDQPACSKACANRLRVKHWYEKNKKPQGGTPKLNSIRTRRKRK